MNSDSNSNITIFTHELFGDTRILQKDGNLLFVAKDVVEKVGNKWNGLRSIQHVPEQWKGVESVSTPGGTQELLCLSEQGLYFYLGRCDKPAALQYQMWIAGEVVPSIRKHGAYIPVNQDDTPEMIMARGLQAAQSIVDELRGKIAEDAPKVELHDRFLDEGEDISIGSLAKKLAQEGLSFWGTRKMTLQNIRCG